MRIPYCNTERRASSKPKRLPSYAHDPKFHTNDSELGAFIAQRFVAKSLAPGAMPDLKSIVQPQTIVSAARPNAQKIRFAVDAKVI